MSNELTHTIKEQQIAVLFFHADEYSLLEIKDIERRIRDKVTTISFFKINVSANPEVGKSFDIHYTPQALILINGKEVWREGEHFSEEDVCDNLLKMKSLNVRSH